MAAISLPLIHGANLDAYYCRDSEVILSGPADTGKTVTMLTKLHYLAHKYDNASIVIARKQLTDTFSTVLQTFKQIIDPSVSIYGGERASWYDYPNGSRVWVAGLDKPGKVLSAEHDIIYINQAEELSLIDWEICTTRTTGRAGNIPYNQTVGDCNPGPPTHWIQSRNRSGALTLFESTHRDNPDLYRDGEITPEGEKRIGALKNLTGARLLRLYHGLWAAPEGAIYDVFEEEKHVVRAMGIPRAWPRAVGIDPFGAQIAALWIAFDPQNGVLNVYREYVEPFGLTTAGHAENILKKSRDETIFAWVCGGPSERAWRLEWQAAGVPVVEPPIKEVWVGIDRVYQLLSEFRLVIHDSCPGLMSEIGDYRRKVGRDGIATEKIEGKEKYHLLDSLRYVIAWLTEPGYTSEVMSLPRARIG